MSSPGRRIRVYVSSTFDDLRDARTEIRTALQRIGVEDVAMETYTAGENRPLTRCLEDVRSCDLYVGIFAWRYGAVPEGETRSITELEYRAAGQAGITRLIFMLDEDAPWPRSRMDHGAAAQPIEAFREHLAAAHDCDLFTGVEELRDKVAEAVSRLVSDLGGEVTDDATARVWDVYNQRLLERYRRLDLDALTPPDRDEMLQVNLREVFVEPSLREDMPPTELPRELARRLHEAAAVSNADLPDGIDHQLFEKTRESYEQRPARRALEVVGALGSRAMVLLGDPGAGKTTLVRYLALALASGRVPGPLELLQGAQPILIELREFAAGLPHRETFTEHLAQQARVGGLGVPAEAFETRLRQGGASVVIFDGLDEVFDPRIREAVSRQIAAFAAAYPEARLLVTSRIVGYRDRVLRDAGFAHHTIQDLERPQIDTFLKAWYALALQDRPGLVDHRRTRLDRAIEESAPIRELAGNPLLLTILAIIGKHQELPRERWKVYDHAASVLVQHWDVNKHLADSRIDADVIGADDKKDLLRRLAYRMQTGGHGAAGVHLADADLVDDIRDYLRERFQYDLERATRIARAMRDQLRGRNFILARYGPGVYGFVHRGLLEFFVASEIVTRFEKARTLEEADLRTAVFGAHWEDPAWHEVLRLITGMVDATVASRMIDHLLTSCTPTRSSALDRPPLAAVTLAAQCLAEVRNLHVAAAPARRTIEAVIALLRLPTRSFGKDQREDRIKRMVLPALAGVGAGWPHRTVFLEHFRKTGRYAIDTPGARLNARIVAALFPGDADVRDLLLELVVCSASFEQRQGALRGLCASWIDDPVTAGCVRRALSEPDDDVRHTALELLTTHWGKEERTRMALVAATADHRQRVRQSAVEYLARDWAGHPGTAPVLRTVLGGDHAPNVRRAAMSALITVDPDGEDTTIALRAATLDPGWEVRKPALQALVSHRHGPETLALVRRALTDGYDDVRATAVELLASRWTEDVATLPAVIRATRDPVTRNRIAALKMLTIRWPDLPEVRDALHRATTDFDDEVRVEAMILTSRAGDEAQAEAAIAGLAVADPTDEMRHEAVRLLGRRWPATTGRVLRQALRDPHPPVREAALTAVGTPDRDAASLLPDLLLLLGDPDEGLRERALSTMAELYGRSAEVFTRLCHAARAARWQTRRIALEALAAAWPDEPQTRSALRRAHRDPVGAVRVVAYAIEAARGSAGPAAGEEGAGRLSDPEDGLRIMAAQRWADAMFGPQAAVERIRAAAAHPVPAIRSVAVTALALRRPDTPDTAAALVAATGDPDSYVRWTAVDTLLAGRASLPAAFRAALDGTGDDDEDIRWLALRGLITCWPDRPETRTAIVHALHDPDADVRLAALHTAILRWPESPEVYDALRDGVVNDDSTVRWVSLTNLSGKWSDLPETLPFLLRAAMVHESDKRGSILHALCAHWPDVPEVRPAVLAGCRARDATVRYDSLRYGLCCWPDDDRVRGAARDGRADIGRWVREAAQAATGGAEPPGIRKALLDTRHPDVLRRYAALAHLLLHEAGSERTLSAVRRSLTDPAYLVRATAAHRLGLAAPTPVVWAAVRTALRDVDGEVRLTAVNLLATAWPTHRDSLETLTSAIRDPSPAVRTAALQAAAEHRPEELITIESLRAALNDPSPEVRTTALETWVRVQPASPEMTTALVGLSRDPESTVRLAAVHALANGHLSAPAAQRSVRSALHDPDGSVRSAARAILVRRGEPTHPSCPDGCPDLVHRVEAVERVARGSGGEPSTAAMIVPFSYDPVAAVRKEAIYALSGRWPYSTEYRLALQARLSDPEPNVRWAVFQQLALDQAGTRQLLDALPAAVHDPESLLAFLSVQVLGLPLERDDIRISLLTQAFDRWPLARWWPLSTLAECFPDRPATRRALRLALCDSRNNLAETAFSYLAARWGERGFGFDQLVRAAGRGSEIAAIVLACQWADSDRAQPLLRAQVGHSSHAVRVASLKALIRHGPGDQVTRDTLIRSVADACPGVRLVALQGLELRWPHDSAASALIREAFADPDIRVQDAMLRSVAARASEEELRRYMATVGDAPTRNFASRLIRAVVPGLRGDDAPLAAAAERPGPLWEEDRDWLAWRLAERQTVG